MQSIPRILAAAFLTAGLALAAACGGGGKEQTSDLPPEDSSELLVANPSQALGKSVDRFEENVESVEALFTFAIEMDGIAFGADGRFSYVSPDSMYMLMNMSGGGGIDLGELGEFEVLLLGDELYMNTGFTGWVKMSLDDFGEGADALRSLREGHTPLDYQKLIDSIGGQVENLGSETVDGKTITRLRVTTDFATLVDSIADSVGDSGGGDESLLPAGLSGPMTLDIMIDPETLLPYKFEANGEFAMNGQSANFAMTFRFFNYNGPVIIPEPPADAKPFDEGSFSDAFGGLNAGD